MDWDLDDGAARRARVVGGTGIGGFSRDLGGVGKTHRLEQGRIDDAFHTGGPDGARAGAGLGGLERGDLEAGGLPRLRGFGSEQCPGGEGDQGEKCDQRDGHGHEGRHPAADPAAAQPAARPFAGAARAVAAHPAHQAPRWVQAAGLGVGSL